MKLTDLQRYWSAYYKKNKSKIRASALKYYYDNIDKCKYRQKQYRIKNRKEIRDIDKERYWTKDKIRDAKKLLSKVKWEVKNRKPLRERRKSEGYYRTPKQRATSKRWRNNNPEKVKEYERRKYLKRKSKKLA